MVSLEHGGDSGKDTGDAQQQRQRPRVLATFAPEHLKLPYTRATISVSPMKLHLGRRRDDGSRRSADGASAVSQASTYVYVYIYIYTGNSGIRFIYNNTEVSHVCMMLHTCAHVYI